MLFTTLAFAVGFLPLVFAGFFLLGRRWPSAAATWLFLASLFFYGYWMPQFTGLLLASIVINYVIGGAIGRCPTDQRARARTLLVVGVVLNLGLLSYFKYANFFVATVNGALGGAWAIDPITLPIGLLRVFRYGRGVVPAVQYPTAVQLQLALPVFEYF